MDKGLSEVVVLRPTKVFWVFLASQLPEECRPALKTVQTNCTAYAIKRHQDKDKTLAEIEQHFSKMFRYEICRWLGAEARNPIEKSYLDFLSCFKMEFHTHLILLEPSIQTGHYLLQLRPRMKLLEWLNAAVEDQQELVDVMDQVTVAHLAENATVIIKHFDEPTAIKPFMNCYYKDLFATAMSRISNNPGQWPKIQSFQDLCLYFSVEIHTQFISYVS